MAEYRLLVVVADTTDLRFFGVTTEVLLVLWANALTSDLAEPSSHTDRQGIADDRKISAEALS